jgi:hypothetical protein
VGRRRTGWPPSPKPERSRRRHTARCRRPLAAAAHWSRIGCRSCSSHTRSLS